MFIVKKFAKDYFISSGLVFILLIVLIGNVSVLDTRATVGIELSCSTAVSEADVLYHLQGALKDGEACEMVSPCENWQAIQCKGTLEVSEFFTELLVASLLNMRVTRTVIDKYGVIRWSNDADLRIAPGTILLVFIYAGFLIEACALSYALWRQQALKKMFHLPPGSRVDQFLKPILFAVFIAALIVAVNSVVYSKFDYPANVNLEQVSLFYKTLPGLIFVVLLAPWVEELIFRGLLLKFFINKNKKVIGTILVSAVFASLHSFREEGTGWLLYTFLLYFLVSLVLCRVFIKQKNLWSSIAFHSSYNATLIAIGFALY